MCGADLVVPVLCGRFDRDVESESFELPDESSGLLLGRVAAGVPFRAQVLIRHLVSDDVVVGDEDVVAGRADRFLGAAPSADLGVVRGQVGAAGAGRGLRGLGERDP